MALAQQLDILSEGIPNVRAFVTPGSSESVRVFSGWEVSARSATRRVRMCPNATAAGRGASATRPLRPPPPQLPSTDGLVEKIETAIEEAIKARAELRQEDRVLRCRVTGARQFPARQQLPSTRRRLTSRRRVALSRRSEADSPGRDGGKRRRQRAARRMGRASDVGFEASAPAGAPACGGCQRLRRDPTTGGVPTPQPTPRALAQYYT